MSDFQPISLQHKPFFDEALAWEDSKSSSDSFGNVFLWDILCRRNVAVLGKRLGIEYLCSRGAFYAYPSGRGDLAPAVNALRARAAEHARPLYLEGVTAPQRAALEAALPGRFRFFEARDDADYIYSVESFATLAGKKLHGKRNFCNRFEAAHDWHYEVLSPAGFDDCRSLLRRWDAEKGGGNAEETRAIERMFQYWDVLGMAGGILYANGKPAAFTAGERLGSDTIDVHFEKALDTLPGAYPMIAREFARHLQKDFPEIRYLNREEDMGIPGLRKAKEEWYPIFMIDKFTALWQEDEA